MGVKLRSVGHLINGDSNKIRLTVVLLLCLLLTAPAQPLSAATDAFKIYLAARGSSDANDGSSWSQSIRTLQQAYEILQEEQPDRPVEVLIGPGEYRCRGMEEPWRFFNGHPITIKALGKVPSPAVDSENHPNRPVFWGIESDGSVCETRNGKPEGNLLTIVHPRIATHVTVKDIKITHYRGGITVTNQKPLLASRIDQNVTIDNVAFVRIGDAYQAWWGDPEEVGDSPYYACGSEQESGGPTRCILSGKAAVMLTYTSGNHFRNNLFRYVRNRTLWVEDANGNPVPRNAGLIHAFYLTSHAAKNEISNSVFHSFSGSIIKITDSSNQNSIIDNRFSWGPVGVLDYFCGCRPSHATLDCRDQCPSWDNYIPYERNAWSNLSWNKLAACYQPIPENECSAPPARSGIRMDLGTGGVLR